jgi:putative membrane protein
MNGASASQSSPAFWSNRFLQALAAGYAILWLLMAIAPLSRQDWFLENLLVFVALPVLVVTYRKFHFSNVSYALIALFLALHAVGAHYTYSEMPVGNWLRDVLHLSRNHYDRVVHFAFGLLITFPLREVVVRAAGVRRGWSYAVPVHVVTAWSGLYELLEALVANLVSPELGAAYTGTQGDIWDPQKDTALAMTGALLSMAFASLVPRYLASRKPARLGRVRSSPRRASAR